MKVVALAALLPLLAVVGSEKAPSVTLPALKLTTREGKSVDLATMRGKPLVLVTTSATCPVCRKYGPALASFSKSVKNANVVFVNPMANESRAEIDQMVKNAGLTSPYLLDPSQKLARALGTRTTTEVFVFDSKLTLQYRGAFDDQYHVTGTKPKPTQNYVIDALAAVAKGNTVKVAMTDAPGCVLDLSPEPVEEKIVYTRDIAKIVNEKCITCHRDGGGGPFALNTYESLKGRSGMMKHVLSNKLMPPWFADDKPSKDSKWKEEKALTPEQLATFTKWFETGMATGDKKDLPTPPKFDTNWHIGPPDIKIQIPAPIKVAADGVMPYQYRTVTAEVPVDRYIQSMEIRPTDPTVVHHVLVFLDTPERAKMTNAQREFQELTDAKSFFAGYVPGQTYVVYPPGFAKHLPKGSKFRFQIHYTPNGKATTDQVTLGLKYATEPVKNEVRTNAMLRFNFAIPPGAERHEVVAENRIGVDGYLMAFMPHMHVRGTAARYELQENGEFKRLLNIPRYDFNWQLRYELKQPIPITAKDRMRFTAWYDNSTKNVANPDPTATVRWGDQTFEEMMLGYFEYYTPLAEPILFR